MPTTYLILDFTAPLMSFGGPKIDAKPAAYRWPTPSMITGLIGSAAGLERRETDRLQELQDALQLAHAVLRPGDVMTDYQTADVTRTELIGPMWSTTGKPFRREASPGALTTRQQWRPYLADASILTALWLTYPTRSWNLDQIAEALRCPMRPLYLGRSSCPPAGPLIRAASEAADPVQALLEAAEGQPIVELVLPAAIADERQGDIYETVYGRRAWREDIHVGADVFVRRRAA